MPSENERKIVRTVAELMKSAGNGPSKDRASDRNKVPSRSAAELIALSEGNARGGRTPTSLPARAKVRRDLVRVLDKSEPSDVPNVRPPASFSWILVPVALGGVFVLASTAVGALVLPSRVFDRGSLKSAEIPKDPFGEDSVVSTRILERLKSLDVQQAARPVPNGGGRFDLLPSPSASAHAPFDPFTNNYEFRDQRIGGDHLLIQPYARVSDLATPSEYLAFLFARFESPEDVSELASHSFLPYSPTAGALQPASAYLEMGQADCDGFSVLACEGLEELGKRKGIDYDPRIITQDRIGEPGHTICTFKDDGQLWAIDQSQPYPVGAVSKPETLSSEFVSSSRMLEFREWLVGPAGVIFEVSLDRHLNPNSEVLGAFVPVDDFDPKNMDFSFLPSQWKSYEETNLCYGRDPLTENLVLNLSCSTFVQFEEGLPKQVSYREGGIEYQLFDERGALTQETMRGGPYKHVFYEDGRKVVGEDWSGRQVQLAD